MKDRAVQRGKPLLDMCYKANRATHEYGENDDRVFCLGLLDCATEALCEECSECGAHVMNAKPLE